MVYRNTNKIQLTKKQLDFYNKFFEIDFYDIDEDGNFVQENLINELDARQDDEHPPISLYFEFENGKEISISLYSGSSNYYDDCILWQIENVNGRKFAEEEFVFDCNYSIDEEMEFDDGEDTYICKIDIE